MKIAFDLKPLDEPYGGGNSFLRNLVDEVRRYNIETVFDLQNPDLDFIFMMDPRWNHPMRNFNSASILKYIEKYPRSLVIHRINECDERKNSNDINKKLRILNCLSDFTILVGTWLYDLDLFCQCNDFDSRDFSTVILNGSDSKIFYPNSKHKSLVSRKLKVVTHHWSSNPMKGAQVYKEMDDLLSKREFNELFEFTYIGNPPQGIELRNTRLISPLKGTQLAEELRTHDVYLTGSINEPGGNHQNEGALSGLPVIYLNSGCMPEYCAGFGVGIDSPEGLAAALLHVRKNYATLRKKMFDFPNNSSSMAAKYLQLFENLVELRGTLIENRRYRLDKRTKVRLKFPI